MMFITKGQAGGAVRHFNNSLDFPAAVIWTPSSTISPSETLFFIGHTTREASENKLRLICYEALGKKNNDHTVMGRIARTNSCDRAPCCARKINENVYHVLGDCAAYAVPRAEYCAKIGFRGPSCLPLPSNKKVDNIMGNGNPFYVDAHIYHFLSKNVKCVLSWLSRLCQDKVLLDW
jgi:hypothetical protein